MRNTEKRKKISIGVEDFKEIIDKDGYFVDKTLMIQELLESNAKVILFTRPRRFGKTLNQFMIRRFFEDEITEKGEKVDNGYLFDGLAITRCGEEILQHQQRYPVIFMTLKSAKQPNFEEAYKKICGALAEEFRRHQYLLAGNSLADDQKIMFQRIMAEQADYSAYNNALRFLSECLWQYHGKNTMILIDEYDVPLDKAYQNGYYREMVSLIRALFGDALKTNNFLQFSVLTGCLRVSKESIFTGLNNFKVLSITDARFDEQFGFTENEVENLLKAYGMASHLEETKEWYDGYRFGDADIFCPWDVINHVDRLCKEPDAKPQSYWLNTSSNELVKCFIDKANKTTRDEIERLIAGEPMEKFIRLELTYDEIDTSIDNLWSVLFTTGYLTQAGVTETGAYKLMIPNREVREVYKLQIQEWFRENILRNTENLTAFWKAVEKGNTECIENYLNRTLSNTISVFDTKAPDAEKENSYHTFLAGLLAGNSNWLVRSNVEAGEGFADIIIEPEDPDAGIIFELKHARVASGLNKSCENAITQIRNRRYEEYLKNDGRNKIVLYGIAFYKKRCKVVVERINGERD